MVDPILADDPDLRVELLYQRDHEMAIFPEDFLLGRMRLGLFHTGLLEAANRLDFILVPKLC